MSRRSTRGHPCGVGRQCVWGLLALALGFALFGRSAISAQSTTTVPGQTAATTPQRSNGWPTGTLAAGTTQATMNLVTSQNAACRYATHAGTAYTAMTATFGTTDGTQHSTRLNGLVSGGRYTFYVRCQGTSGAANSDDFPITFNVATATAPTPNPTASPDTSSPTVTITRPLEGATVAGTITIQAVATHKAGIAGVAFLVDGTVIGADQASPYFIRWNTSGLAPGSHTIRAQAYDTAGNVGTSRAVTVTVSNNQPPPVSDNRPPSVTMTSPIDRTSYAAPATLTVAAEAIDADGTIAHVDFYAGSTRIGSDTTRPFSVIWTSSGAGTYAFSASAVDNDGATTRSRAVSVTVTASATSAASAIFTPSIPDTDLMRYVLDIFRYRSDGAITSPVATQNLGKPPVADGEISADISRTLASLPDGTYVATVTAVASRESARSEPSPPFVVRSRGMSSTGTLSYAPDTVDPAPDRRPTDDGQSTKTADGGGSTETLWITDASTSLVTALDATTGDVLATVPVGLRPMGIVAPQGVNKVYVADEGSDTVSVISKATMTVVATIPLPEPFGRQPHHVSASPDGRFVYVGERGSNVVDVIDTATDRVSARFATGWPGSKTVAVVPDPGGELLYAVNRSTSPSRSTLTALEGSTGGVRWQLPIDDPGHFLVGPDGRTGVLSHNAGGTITLIDLERRTVTNAINVGAGAEIDGLQLSGNGRYLVATLRAAPAGIIIVDLMETTPVRIVPLGAVARLMVPSAMEPLYISVSDSKEFPAGVTMVDVATQRIVRHFRLPGGGTPHAVAFDGRR